MALIGLYRATGDKQTLDLAGYILQGMNASSCRSQVRLSLLPDPVCDAHASRGHAVPCNVCLLRSD